MFGQMFDAATRAGDQVFSPRNKSVYLFLCGWLFIIAAIGPMAFQLNSGFLPFVAYVGSALTGLELIQNSLEKQ